MVHHSFMLNPRNYLADCIRYGKTSLWSTGMPWKAVDAVIDNETFAYRPSENAQKAFEAATNSPWNNLDEPPCMVVRCPTCRTQLDVPWTTCDSADYFAEPSSRYMRSLEGQGYADAEFVKICACSSKINHELLRAEKFTRDVQKLMAANNPMPGGFLSLNGATTPV